MIKCIGFGKLLKQLFIISLISCFGLLGSSFVNAGFVRQIGISGYSPYDNSVDISVLNKGSFLSTSLGIGLNAFYLAENYYFAWIYNNDLGTSSIYNHTNGNQGFLKHFAVCDELTGDSINWSLTSSLHCVSYEYNSYNTGLISNLLSSVNSDDYFGFDFKYSSNTYRSTLCISNHFLGKSVCFDNCYVSNPNNYSCVMYGINSMNGLNVGDTTGSLNLGGQFGQIDRFLLTSSPAVSISNFNTGNNEVLNPGELEGINYVGLTGEDIINYFENHPLYNFNRNVCYVGTDDITTNFGDINISDIQLKLGTGKNLFEYFSYYYGNNFTIKNLGNFVSTLRSNYITLFLTPYAERLYVMQYNTGGGVSFEYDSEYLTPSWYVGKPYVEYLYGQITSAFGSVDDGEEIATYCYYKLGINNDSNYSGVIDNHDSSYDENALNYKENYLRNSYHFTGGIIVSESWAGTPLDYLDGTGEENLDFATFFNKTFNKFKEKASFEPSDLPFVGFLPTYIILFMIAIIFFRFISH